MGDGRQSRCQTAPLLLTAGVLLKSCTGMRCMHALWVCRLHMHGMHAAASVLKCCLLQAGIPCRPFSTFPASAFHSSLLPVITVLGPAPRDGDGNTHPQREQVNPDPAFNSRPHERSEQHRRNHEAQRTPCMVDAWCMVHHTCMASDEGSRLGRGVACWSMHQHMRASPAGAWSVACT